MMHNWTSDPGYPVVKVSILNNKINLAQERFFSSPVSKEKTNDRKKWQIPVSLVSTDTWLKINFGESGFYRTAYSTELLEKLRIPVEEKVLSARDRLGIVRDLFALAEAGTIPTTNVLNFLSSYKNEDNYSVWIELALGLGKLESIFAHTKMKN